MSGSGRLTGKEYILHRGYIKLWRRIQDNPIKSKPLVLALWIDLLIKASHKPSRFIWNGCETILNEGQILTGIHKLSKDTGISIQSIRTGLEVLKSTNKVTIETTTKFSIITINNWSEYQDTNNQTNKQLTNNQQTTNKQLTTYKNDKNDKNDKNEEEDNTANVFNYYQNNIGIINPIVQESIRSYLLDTPIDWIKEAINESAKHNKLSWSYCEAILKSWKKKGHIDKEKKKELSYEERRAIAEKLESEVGIK